MNHEIGAAAGPETVRPPHQTLPHPEYGTTKRSTNTRRISGSALAEYSFLQHRLSFWLDDDSQSITVHGNLLSAAWTLYQGAINGGILHVGHLPESVLPVAGLLSLLSDSAPRPPYRVPPLEDVPVAAARVPKEVEALGSIGTAGKPIQITLRGTEYTIPDWHMEEISYTKRTAAAVKALRAEFEPVREEFVKDLAENHAAALRDAGMSDADIANMVDGQGPRDYEVHHKLPLDDGGTNAISNLLLIKADPDHRLITNYQNEQTRGMSAGQTRRLEWPMPDSRVLIWPKTPGGGAYPTVHKLVWSVPDSRVSIWPKISDGDPRRALIWRASMSDIDDLLAAINVRERKFAQMMQPPASPEAIERLRRFAVDTLQADLPEGYLTFLRKHDGLVFNGRAICAATERRKPYFLPGFVETNEIFGEGDDRFVYYGKDDITLYAQDRASRAWVALNVPGLDVMDTFPSFDAMLAQMLRDSLKRWTSS